MKEIVTIGNQQVKICYDQPLTSQQRILAIKEIETEICPTIRPISSLQNSYIWTPSTVHSGLTTIWGYASSSIFDYMGSKYLMKGSYAWIPPITFRWIGNGWIEDSSMSIGLQGGWFSKPTVFTMDNVLYAVIGNKDGISGSEFNSSAGGWQPFNKMINGFELCTNTGCGAFSWLSVMYLPHWYPSTMAEWWRYWNSQYRYNSPHYFKMNNSNYMIVTSDGGTITGFEWDPTHSYRICNNMGFCEGTKTGAWRVNDQIVNGATSVASGFASNKVATFTLPDGRYAMITSTGNGFVWSGSSWDAANITDGLEGGGNLEVFTDSGKTYMLITDDTSFRSYELNINPRPKIIAYLNSTTMDTSTNIDSGINDLIFFDVTSDQYVTWHWSINGIEQYVETGINSIFVDRFKFNNMTYIVQAYGENSNGQTDVLTWTIMTNSRFNKTDNGWHNAWGLKYGDKELIEAAKNLWRQQRGIHL